VEEMDGLATILVWVVARDLGEVGRSGLLC
jgi:hypothetical protein